RLDRGAEGKTREHERRIPESLLDVRSDAEQVFGFAPAFVMHALGGADAAEVGAQRHVAQLDEGSRESLHDLVVVRPSVERVRMGDERRAARCTRGTLEDRLEDRKSVVEGKGV